jgi:hypothetical protein
MIAALVGGHAVAQGKRSALSMQPDTLVSRFYAQVVARHPLGMPEGEDMKVLSPYLSKALRHKLELSKACFADWHRQYPDPNLKPPSLFVEDGLFSGSSEEAEPKAFHIENTELDKAGASRVTVRLMWDDPFNKPYFWYVAAIVIPENGRPAIDDVLYLKHMGGERGWRLSKALSLGCKGLRWVGWP